MGDDIYNMVESMYMFDVSHDQPMPAQGTNGHKIINDNNKKLI